MADIDETSKRGELVLIQLKELLDRLSNSNGVTGTEVYSSYLHGQVYGLATALKILFPGPDNLGEKAAMAVRPVITEHRCECDE